MSTECIFLSKHEYLGFLNQIDTEICKITTSLALEPLALEVTAKQPDKPLPYRGVQFICSPVDISVHRNVDLHDVEVSENIQKCFETSVLGICKILFSNDSEGFRHTNLVTKDIETGDSPPISHKPYNLSLQNTTLVQKELEALKRQQLLSEMFCPGLVPL